MPEEVVGGIVGFLRMDADQFHREIAKALAELKVLQGQDLTVKVRAEGVDKVARSSTTAARSLDDLTDSTRRVEDATSRVRVAELKLDEVRSRANATASQHLSAMQALTRARRAEQDAVFATYQGNVKISESNDAVAKSARTASRDVGQMGRSFKGLHDPRVIVAGVAAGMSLLGPVAGTATAAVGGLVGVLGTGALAFNGFKKEIEQGTTLGKVMQTGLDGLKGSFNDLSAVAARSMAGGVLDALATLRTQLPALSGDVQILGAHLGSALSIGTKGLIAGLHTMMPLLQDGGRYAEILAQKMSNFAGSAEFRQFVEYSQRQLPLVVGALTSVAGGITDLGVALAPVGDDLVELIRFSGDAASALAPLVRLLSTGSTGILATQLNGLKDQSSGIGRVLSFANPLMALYVRKTSEAGTASDGAAQSTTALAGAASRLNPIVDRQAAAYGVTSEALQRAVEGQRAAGEAAMQATARMQQENNAAGLLQQALDALSGKSMSMASAQNAFDSSLVNMGDHITKTGKKVKFTTTSIQNMSSASVELRGQLLGQVKNAEQVAGAYGQMTGSTEAGRQKLIALRAQIISNAVAHGVDRKAVTAYIDTVLKVPKSVPPTKLEVDTRAALMRVGELQQRIAGLNGKVITITTRFVDVDSPRINGSRSTRGGITKADGGYISGPGTGTSDSIPAWLSNGEYVINAAATSKHKDLLTAINAGKFANGGPVGFAAGGPVSVPLGDFYSRYTSSLGPETSRSDVVSARNAAALATRRLRIAEQQLRQDRRKHKSSLTIARDERAVASARVALAAATAKATQAQARYNAQRQSPLARFGSALSAGVKNAAAFVANIEKLASRGFVALAQQLAAMGGPEAEAIAAQAAGASTTTLRGMSANITKAAAAQAQLDNINGITAVLGSIRRGNVDSYDLAASSGLDIGEILDAVALIKSLLAGNKNASKLLADLADRSSGQLFADGGITETHVAHIATSRRTFGEPETGGEAYIPLSPAKRSRSTAILSEANRRMGSPLGGGGDGSFTGTLVLDSGQFLGLVSGFVRQSNADQARAVASGRGTR